MKVHINDLYCADLLVIKLYGTCASVELESVVSGSWSKIPSDTHTDIMCLITTKTENGIHIKIFFKQVWAIQYHHPFFKKNNTDNQPQYTKLSLLRPLGADPPSSTRRQCWNTNQAAASTAQGQRLVLTLLSFYFAASLRLWNRSSASAPRLIVSLSLPICLVG